ncbi:hypothetical protein TNCV_2906431 [Trichonephila clavipes]|nr:hypothetical protein TNCV_2906431 [Trichonephila clavipes]
MQCYCALPPKGFESRSPWIIKQRCHYLVIGVRVRERKNHKDDEPRPPRTFDFAVRKCWDLYTRERSVTRQPDSTNQQLRRPSYHTTLTHSATYIIVRHSFTGSTFTRGICVSSYHCKAPG